MVEYFDIPPLPDGRGSDSVQLTFRVQPGRYAVCRLLPDAPPPEWAFHGEFWSVTRTREELSVVCAETAVPEGIRAEKDWVCFQLVGPFEFALTGILEAFLRPLARAKVPIFALSTFDTDWVLIPATRRTDALKALAEAGHILEEGL
jgi:hypothetical protein